MPWVKIPAATITFQGEATVHNVEEIPQEIQKTLLRGLELDQKEVSRLCIIKVNPRGNFLTYGVGMSLLTMRYPESGRRYSKIRPFVDWWRMIKPWLKARMNRDGFD